MEAVRAAGRRLEWVREAGDMGQRLVCGFLLRTPDKAWEILFPAEACDSNIGVKCSILQGAGKAPRLESKLNFEEVG